MNLIKLHLVGHDQAVVLTVHGFLLQTGIQLIKGHRCGTASQAFNNGHINGSLHHPELQPLAVVGGCDRTLAVGEVANGALAPFQGADPDHLREVLLHILSKFPVQLGIGVFTVVEQIGHRDRVELRHVEVGNHVYRRNGGLHGIELHCLDQLPVTAQNRVAVNLYLDASV